MNIMKENFITNLQNNILEFSKLIIGSDLKDTAIDLSEVCLDSLIENDSIKEIPVLSKVFSVVSFGKKVQNHFEFKKAVAFLQQLQKGTIDSEKLEKRRLAYQENKKWFKKEVEQVLLYLSRLSSVEKAKIQAELYIDLINEKITFDQFNEHLDILDRLFLQDLSHLSDINFAESKLDPQKDDVVAEIQFNLTRCSRMTALGLLYQLHPFSYGFSKDNYFRVSETGKYWCDIFGRFQNKLIDKDSAYNDQL